MLTIEIKREFSHHSIRWLTIGCIAHKYRGSAYTSWYKNGQKLCEIYRVNGKYHRDPSEGPAYTAWHSNGQNHCKGYMVNGKLHRDPREGPAVTVWHENGQKYYEEYKVNGRTHKV